LGLPSVRPYFDGVFSAHIEGFISEVNLAEFYYKTALKKGVQTVDLWYRQIRQSPFTIISPNETITRQAAIWKVKRNYLSLADCFALATVQEVAQVLLTTDSALADVKGIKSIHIPIW
jgi:predicted nucleic acid-binding protein